MTPGPCPSFGVVSKIRCLLLVLCEELCSFGSYVRMFEPLRIPVCGWREASARVSLRSQAPFAEKTFHSAGCILFHPSAWGVPTLGLPVHLFSQSHSSSGAVSSKKSSLIISRAVV